MISHSQAIELAESQIASLGLADEYNNQLPQEIAFAVLSEKYPEIFEQLENLCLKKINPDEYANSVVGFVTNIKNELREIPF